MRTAPRGYTLFEVVLVLALLVILGAIAYAALDVMYADVKVTAGTDAVRAAWARARAQATNEGRPYRFAIVPNGGNYRVAPDSAEFWFGEGDSAAAQDSEAPPLVLEESLPKGVTLTAATTLPAGLPADASGQAGNSGTTHGVVDPQMWTNLVTFLPDGTAQEDVEIVFRARGARPVVLKLRGLTGVVTIKPLIPSP